MANVRFDQLPAAASVGTTDLFAVQQGTGTGGLKKATSAQLGTGLTVITPTQVLTNNVVNTVGGNIWYFGDSVTLGTGTTSNSFRYSTVLAGYMGLTEQNFGINGNQASQLVLSTIPTKGATDRFIVFEYGTNEVLNSTSPATYTTNMQNIINNALGKGWLASQIIITGTFGSFYTVTLNSAYIAMNNAAAAVASSNSCVYVECYNSMLNSQSLAEGSTTGGSAGGNHPNNEGALLIVKSIQAAIQPLYNTASGQAQISNGVNELKSVLVRNVPIQSGNDNDFLLSVDQAGNVGLTNSLRNGTQLNTCYLRSNLIGATAFLPSSFSGNDIILPQPTKIFSMFSPSLYNYIQIGDANLYMNYGTNYSAAKWNWLFGAITIFSIDVPTKTASTSAGGATSKMATVGGKLKDYFTDQGNSTTTETDLYTHGTEANILSVNGNTTRAQYSGIFVSSATATRDLRLYFGGVTAFFDTGALTTAVSSNWNINITIIRVSATVARFSVVMTATGQTTITSVGEITGLTLSGSNILKVTGQAGSTGAATNDIVAKLGYVSYIPAAV